MVNQILINPKIRFGQPIIKGTRVTVEEVLGMLATGMDFVAIKKEYNIEQEQILVAIRYVDGWMRGEVTKEYVISTRR